MSPAFVARAFLFAEEHGIAQLMRLGWFRSVHCKSLPAQELRAILTARKLVQGKHHDLLSLRGILRGRGLKVSAATALFDDRIRELVDGHTTLLAVADASLLVRATPRAGAAQGSSHVTAARHWDHW